MEPTGQRIKLLIVDDEKASRDVLAGLLANSAREIRTAGDGLEAKQILGEESFDLILTDLNMPGMDGMELLRFVRKRYPQAMVIMVTGYATLENTLKAIEEGAYDYITKPFKLAEMDILIRNACEKIMLTRDRDLLVTEMTKTHSEVENLSRRVQTMHRRIRQLEEQEEDLFLGNFDLRLPVSPESLPLRYSAKENSKNHRELLISRLEEMRKTGELTEEDFFRYLRRLRKKQYLLEP